MRKELVLLVLAVTAAGTAGRAEPRAMVATPAVASSVPLRQNVAIETQRTRLVGSVRPEVRAKLKDPVHQTLEAAGKKTTAAADLPSVARQAVKTTFGDLPAADIEAMVYIVMLEAEKSAREDVRSIMEDVKAINQAKACQRDLQCLDQLVLKGDVFKRAVGRAKDDVKTKLDSLSEMGESESLRLQMAMDRLSKMTSTLSNILKKISDTAQSATQNLK